MKIVFSNYDDINNPFYGGGGAYAIHSVAKRLAKKHDVLVITHTFPGATNCLVDGVRYKRIGISGFGARRGQILFKLLLPFYALKTDCDIWIESFIPPFNFGLLPLILRKPVVGLTHLLSGRAMEEKYHLPFSFFERLGLKQYSFFITLTEHLRNKIVNANKKAHIVVIPNGVEKSPVKTLGTPTNNYILYIGRIDIHQKGLDTLINAYRLIKDKMPLKLLIAGSGKKSEVMILHKMIIDYKLSGLVEYVGFVSGKRKSTLLHNAAFTVLPSRFESFGISVLESFHYKKGVVVSNIVDLTWIPQNASHRFTVGSDKSLASTLLKLSRDKKKQSLLGSEGYKKVGTSFNWDTIADQYEMFLESIIEGMKKND